MGKPKKKRFEPLQEGPLVEALRHHTKRYETAMASLKREQEKETSNQFWLGWYTAVADNSIEDLRLIHAKLVEGQNPPPSFDKAFEARFVEFLKEFHGSISK